MVNEDKSQKTLKKLRFKCFVFIKLSIIISTMFAVSLLSIDVEASTVSKKTLYSRLFEQPPQILPPTGKYNQKQIEKWRKRYSGNDPDYDADLMRYQKRRGWDKEVLEKKLAEGWSNLTSGSDLQMVYKKCLKYKVPFDVIYLALAESHWKNVRSRAGASGIWQFMPSTARLYGLRVGYHNGYKRCRKRGRHKRHKCRYIDERYDVEKSTDAALRYLKDLKNMTYRWDGRKTNPKISESDRWLWAFWSYNRGPGKVKRYYRLLKGDVKRYAQKVRRYNTESSNYINKLFGLRLALRDKFYNNNKKFAVVKSNDKIKTKADKLYEQYVDGESKLTPAKKLQRLETIKKEYTLDLKNNRHTETWVEAAIDVIETEMADVKREHAQEFSRKRNYTSKTNNLAKIITSVDVAPQGGELTAGVQKGDQRIDVDITVYEVLPGDSIDDIALRLSGDVNNRFMVKQLIKDLNPEIKEPDKIFPGQKIKVPAKYAEVPNKKLVELVKEWYSNQPIQDAIWYLKYLNGINPQKGAIRPGDVILVPVL
jgi:hypothetical protein